MGEVISMFAYVHRHWLPIKKGPARKAAPVLRPYHPLRDQFEPLGLSSAGFDDKPERCAKDWDFQLRTPEAATDLVDQITRATAWLQKCKRIKSVNGRAPSYSLKHECEQWCRSGCSWCNCYISNGALIMAAILSGFIYKRPPRCKRRSQNAFINIATYGRPRYQQRQREVSP